MLTVTEEAITQLYSLRNRVIELHKDLLQGARNLTVSYGEHASGLGAHNDEIKQLLEALIEDSGDAVTIKRLTRKLDLSAKVIKVHRDNSVYTGKTK